LLNRQGVAHFLSYLFLALALWVAVLNSGVHATLAGVAAAFFIPLHGGRQRQPLKTIEEALSRPVAFLVLPVFAFCNAGIPVAGLSPGSLVEAAPLGIAMGLLLGKQVGVFGFTWLAVKLRLGQLPAGVGWRQIHAVAVLCGIGFTMSLFIAGLAFDGHGAHLNATSRLGILLGSCLSAIAGYVLLARQLPRRR
jgi:NhaA family Na+:H+ antiporter